MKKYFDKIYCINLDRRNDRWDQTIKELNKWGFSDVERYSAIDGNTIDRTKYNSTLNNGELGLVLTNINIINEAKEHGFKRILILEDDIVFTSEIERISDYINLLPKDCDMLYFGGNHNTHMNVIPPITINEKVCKLHSTFTTHCVGINESMYPVVINTLNSLNSPLDVAYTELQKKYNVYSFYPAIALQRVGYSDIQNGVRDYNWLIK